jgi:hypothetical protein
MNNDFKMDKPEIKKAALDFRAALINWRDNWWNTPSFIALNKTWTDEEKVKGTAYHSCLINPILESCGQILDLCISEDIDEPFDFQGYASGQVGRVLSDELSFPEITEPYHRLARLLTGGIEGWDFWETKYCKEKLMPKKFKSRNPPSSV